MKNLNLYSNCNWSFSNGQGCYVKFLSGGVGV